MSLNFINVEYCYDYLVNQIPMELLLYSHLPIAIIALAFCIFILAKSKSLSTFLLFMTCFLFAIWSSLDLSAWFAFLGSSNTMFAWSLLDFIAVLMFFFGYYFIYVFISGKDLPVWQKIVGVLALLPVAYVSFLGLNISAYDLNTCEAIENGTYTKFTYLSEVFFILSTLFFVIYQYRSNKDKNEKRRILLSGIGILIFFLTFFSASFLVWLLSETNAALYAYNYLIYGLFGMPVFLIYLGYLIVRYRAFDLRVFTAQALSITSVALVGAQLAFLRGTASVILNLVTLLLIIIVSIYLTRNVKKEIAQREKIEILAKDLEAANGKLKELDQMKSEFLSLASHQMRAPLTTTKGYASMLMEGEFGTLPKKAEEATGVILRSTQNMINTVNDFLNISRIEQGRMVYEKTDFDVSDLLKEVIEERKVNIEKAELSLKVELPTSVRPIITADRDKTRQIIGNILDNSVKYTVSGGITISLNSDQSKAIIKIKDTGIGIDPSEIGKLFNKFSRSKSANKTNVIGTGLGLYIAKKMAEDQGGDIKVFSEGEGKGSTFTIELPKAKV